MFRLIHGLRAPLLFCGAVAVFYAQATTFASTFKPTVLVDTEAFITIDDSDSAANVEVRFGDTLNEKIIYDRSNIRFRFTRSVLISGTLSTTGAVILNIGNQTSAIPDTGLALEAIGTISGSFITLDGPSTGLNYMRGNLGVGGTQARTKLEVFGTISGALMTISGNVQIDGTTFYANTSTNRVGIGNIAPKTTLEVTGTISGSSLSITGLKNCDTIDTNVNGTLICGTDDGGAGGGLTQANADQRYVTISGGTMTGVLVIQNGNTHAATTTPLLNVRGTMSGRSLSISGTGSIPVLKTDISTGRVGIGVNGTAPKATLAVNGTISGSRLDLTTNSVGPSAPSYGALSIYSMKRAAQMPFTRSNSQRPVNLVDSLLGSSFACIVPGTGTTPVSLGIPSNVTVTASHPAQANTNLSTSLRRTRYATSTTAGNSAGNRANLTMVWRGNAAGLGGFTFYTRFFVSTTTAQQRYFLGLDDTTAVIGNVNPSTLTNVVYVGIDSTQTTLRVCTNDNSGTATCTDLGANFPAATITAVYDVWFYAPPNGSSIDYYVERLDSAFTAQGSITTDLPQNTVFLAPQVWVNNGSTAAAAQLEVVNTCVLTDL